MFLFITVHFTFSLSNCRQWNKWWKELEPIEQQDPNNMYSYHLLFLLSRLRTGNQEYDHCKRSSSQLQSKLQRLLKLLTMQKVPTKHWRLLNLKGGVECCQKDNIHGLVVNWRQTNFLPETVSKSTMKADMRAILKVSMLKKTKNTILW